MRFLTLIRHAKSSWADPNIPDIDRPLNERGTHDAPRMGRRLSDSGFMPDLVLSSPAERARRTAKVITRELKKKPAFAIEPSLYLAEPEEMLDLVRRLGDSVAHVVLVGHNPGLTELAVQLGAAGIDNVPTAGVVRFELDVDSWAESGPGKARLVDFDYPRRERA